MNYNIKCSRQWIWLTMHLPLFMVIAHQLFCFIWIVNMSDQVLHLKIKRVPCSTRRCAFPACVASRSLKNLLQADRFYLARVCKIYVPPVSRVCPIHADKFLWQNSDVANGSNDFSKEHIEDMFQLLTERSIHFETPLVFKNTDSSMKMRSAYSIAEFQSLLQSVPSLLNKLGADASNALFVYLMKLRLGDSNEAIAQYFETNRWKIAETLNIVRKSLLTDIVPKYVNHARSRVDLLSHCSELSRKLFLQGDEDRMVAIWDATYIYVEKSLNHQFQKQTYNSHKKRNYVKPMVCVASDGTIICTVGPFKATENDASIMTKIIPKNIPAMRNFIENDVMLVDRGFRDCVEDFEERGFEVRIPAHAGGMQQLSTIEANRTRFVTKCRFEIERINGVMKNKFKIFSKVQETYWIPNIMDDFTIAAALNNHLNSIRPARTTSSADNDETARKMLERLSQPNLLHDALKGIKFAAVIRAKKYHVFENQLTFPNLQYADLKSISLGVYQINQSKLYAYDHIRLNNNQFILYTFPEECSTFWEDFKTQNRKPVLLMINIKSRFVSARKYRAFVLYDANKQGADTILGYYCSCKNGLRTVGCCSHTMTIIYYLGFAQYNGGVREPSKHLREVFNRTNHDENEPDTDTEECDDHGENDAEEYLSMI